MEDIINKLKEGDLRSIGKSPEIVKIVLKNHSIFKTVVHGMCHEDPGVRMRASDAAEKITRTLPELLGPYKEYLLDEVLSQSQQEVRWHAAQMIPRLVLDKADLERAVNGLFGFLDDGSRIVQVNSLQALVDLVDNNPDLLPRVIETVNRFAETGSPAVKIRAKKLQEKLVRNKSKFQSNK